MENTWPVPYSIESGIAPGSVPVSVVVLTKNEAVNIVRCLRSVAFAEQIVVVDSGSSDETAQWARTEGAEVIETGWRGFAAQRQFALELSELRHDWVMFVDADEWVSTALAREIGEVIEGDRFDACWMYFRLVFQGRWIRHCGWYPSGRIIRLMRRTHVSFGTETFSEHPRVLGRIGRLRNDLVDEDLKGLPSWLHKHVDYAVLEDERRSLAGTTRKTAHDSRIRSLLKDVVAPKVPARPIVQFVYMYIFKRGFLDGRPGFSFCFYHAWFQFVVSDLGQHAKPASSRTIVASGRG